jgi:DNA-binding PadR family transcriptional regulator
MGRDRTTRDKENLMHSPDWNPDDWKAVWKLRHAMAGRGRGHGRGGHRGPPGFGPPPFGFPPGMPFGMPGRGRFMFRRGGRMKRGDVRAAILALLAEQPRNGYQIMQERETRSRGMWRPSPGSVYPALQLLEDEGLVRAQEGAGGRVFELTEQGRKVVAEKGEQAPWESAASAADDKSFELLGLAGQIGAAAAQVLQSGNEAQIAEARKALVATRRALYRILAEDDLDDE